jgi:hypothetical protein
LLDVTIELVTKNGVCINEVNLNPLVTYTIWEYKDKLVYIYKQINNIAFVLNNVTGRLEYINGELKP